MNGMIKYGVALLCLGSSLVAPLAQADIPPDTTCTTKGAICDNPERGLSHGVCKTSTCSKYTADGFVDYECLSCVGTQDGAAGATGETHETGQAGEAGARSVVDERPSVDAGADEDSGGCGIGKIGTEKGIASLLLAFGLAALAISRRRR